MDKVRECAIAELKELQSEMELAERVQNLCFFDLKKRYDELAEQLKIYDEKVAKTYGEETIEDIIAELADLHKQEQILLNRLDYKLKTMKGEKEHE